MAGRWGMRQRAASEAGWGVVNHSAQRLWPLLERVRPPFSHVPALRWGRADSLKTVSGTRQGRIQSAIVLEGAVVPRSGIQFPAHIIGSSLWAPEIRASEMSISWLDGKASHSRSDSRRHSRERKDLEVGLLATGCSCQCSSRLLRPGKRGSIP